MDISEKPMTEKESLALITAMINKARDSYYDTGVSAMMWGIVIAVCSLVQLSELQFGYRLPVDIYWLTVLAVIPQIMISAKAKKERVVRSYDEAYMTYIWRAFGISIFLLIIITNVIYNSPAVATHWGEGEKQTGFVFFEYTSSFFLLLYGIPTFITGAACKFKAMLWGGLLCWVCCLLSLFTSLKVDLLLTAFSAIAAWLIPGILMQQEYRKAKKEMAGADV